MLLIFQSENVLLTFSNWCWIFPLNFYSIILELVLHKMQTEKKIINNIFWFDCIAFQEILLLGIIHVKNVLLPVSNKYKYKGIRFVYRNPMYAYIIGILLHQLDWFLLLQHVALRDMSTGYLLFVFWIFYYPGLHCTLNIC